MWPQTAQVLRAHCEERQIDLTSETRVFLNHRGAPLTRFGVRYILGRHLERARATVATLARKRLHPHSMPHSTAVALLKSRVDLSTISQWLGHASLSTTNRYASIDLDLKRQAIARVKPISPPFLAQERDGFGVAGEALNYRCKVELATARMPAFKGLSQLDFIQFQTAATSVRQVLAAVQGFFSC